MKEILIVEDKITAAQALKAIVEEECENAKVYLADSLEEALKISMLYDIEMMLVDVVLNPADKADISGIEFIRKIRHVDKYKFVPIVMVTSLEDPKMMAYEELHCYSFIEKPYNIENVKKVIRETLEYKLGHGEEKYVFKSDGIIYSVNKNEILYINTVGKKMVMQMKNDRFAMPYVPIKKLAEELSEDFVQCNRNCIVNKRNIKTADFVNRIITVDGIDEEINIGLRMKKNVAEVVNNGR
ncbi:MAG: response regulator transcription factor [Lachnospiraceae bacterium]|nr:response regulator transcription factor [Lachnospiraceae bacterium]